MDTNSSDFVRRQAAWRYGIEGEKYARQYFLEKKYQILGQNFRSRRGELDLIVYQSQVLVFVEVKARKPPVFIDPIYSLTPAKCQRMRLAAEFYLTKARNLPTVKEIRFDLLLLTASRVEKHYEGVLFL